MPAQAVTPLKPLRPAVLLTGARAPESSRPPPPLPSMRVPKGTHRYEEDDSEREWSLRAAEVKARLQSVEDREWAELMARAKAAQQASEEEEWRKLRERAQDATHDAEEREWQQLARARSLPPHSPASASLHPFDAPRRPFPPKQAPRIVQWP